MVSTAAWQSAPAVKPGPTPTTTGAMSRVVPRFRLARMASTTAPGTQSRHAGGGGVHQHGDDPVLQQLRDLLQIRAAGLHTLHGRPSQPHRLGEAGLCGGCRWAGSPHTEPAEKPQRYRRRAIPVAISPAPRITTSISNAPFAALRHKTAHPAAPPGSIRYPGLPGPPLG